MMLFYIDESGTGLKDNRSPFFIFSALAIPAEHWKELDDRIATLKRQLVSWAKTEDYEIKGRDMRHGEKVFKSLDWSKRLQVMNNVAELIASLPCKVCAVQVDKRDLPTGISPDDLYRMAFWRLLDMLELELESGKQPGMLMVDSRASDLHSSVQDRRLIDAYREWVERREKPTNLIELPWFGFSAFYAGLQLADFAAYMIDCVSHEGKKSEDIRSVFEKMHSQVQIAQIP